MTKTVSGIFSAALKEQGWDESTLYRNNGFFPTGNLEFDYRLGGGLPKGRTAEFSGLQGSGKTTMACMIAANVLRAGGTVLYLDFEQALDVPYMSSLGIDASSPQFYMYPASSLEDGMDLALEAIRTGEVSLIVADSVPAMVPQASVTADGALRTGAMERARLLQSYLSRMNPLLKDSSASLIMINHIQVVIETGWSPAPAGSRTTTPGGSALKYYASVRVEFKLGKSYSREIVDVVSQSKVKEKYASDVFASVTKNKVAVPYQTAELYLELGKGFSNVYSALRVLTGHGIVKKSGSFYIFPQELYHPNMTSGDKGSSIQGQHAILDVAAMDCEWGDKLIARAVSVLPRRSFASAHNPSSADSRQPALSTASVKPAPAVRPASSEPLARLCDIGLPPSGG